VNVMRTLFLVSLIWSGCGGPAPAELEQADAGLTCRGGTTACDICGYTSCCPEANACATSPQCSAAQRDRAGQCARGLPVQQL
jgi:hypothetical protein